MAINMTTARKLCTKPELELVLDTTAARIKELTPAGLRSRVRRARTLRDKYSTLASRQRRVVRGKQEKRGLRPSKGNENTIRKQEIFGAALEKFEAKLAKLEAAQARKAPAARKKSKATRKAGGRSSQPAPAEEAPRRTARKPFRTGSTQRITGMPAVDGFGGVGRISSRNTSFLTRSTASKGKRVRRTQQQANRPAIGGHVSARGRRNQAKRDSR